MMASFSAVGCDFPSILLIVRHSLEESVLWSKVSTNCLHFCCLWLLVAWLISSFICRRAGEVGSRVLRLSRALIMSVIAAGRGSVWLSLCLPDGM